MIIGKILAASVLAAGAVAFAPSAYADDCWGGNIVTPFGSYCDSLPWGDTGIHRHCEYVMGWGSCSWRYADNTLAPQPWDVAPAGIEPGFIA